MAEFDLFKEVDAAWHRLTQYPGPDYDKPSFRMGFEACAELLGKLGWHPASELPVIPEGKNWVKVVALVDFGDNTLRPRHEIYKDKGWSKKDMWTVKYWCYPPKEE